MDIYWSASVPEDSISPLLFSEPEPAYSYLLKIDTFDAEKISNFKFCPATKAFHENLFYLKSPIDYELIFDSGKIGSYHYDQNFFDKMFLIRSLEGRSLSAALHYFFIPDCDSLEIEQTSAFTIDNDFANKAIVVPGRFDLGKWPRPIDCGFLVKEGVTSLKFEKDLPYCGIRFHTKEKIVFKKFRVSDTMHELKKEMMSLKRYKSKQFSKLSYFYDIFTQSKYKKLFLEEAKKNLVE